MIQAKDQEQNVTMVLVVMPLVRVHVQVMGALIVGPVNNTTNMSQRKPYNPNTAYGRRKLREQTQEKYDNGTPEYRQDIDQIGNIIWLIVIVFVVIVFFAIAFISGPEAAIKWLK